MDDYDNYDTEVTRSVDDVLREHDTANWDEDDRWDIFDEDDETDWDAVDEDDDQ